MALTNTVPTVWEGWLDNDYKSFPMLNSTVIVEGDKVKNFSVNKVAGIDDISVHEYVPYSDDIIIEKLTDVARTVRIDQYRYCAFQVDIIDDLRTLKDTVEKAKSKGISSLLNSADIYCCSLYEDAFLYSKIDIGFTQEEFKDFYLLAITQHPELANGRLIVGKNSLKYAINLITDYNYNINEGGYIGNINGVKVFFDKNIIIDEDGYEKNIILSDRAVETWIQEIGYKTVGSNNFIGNTYQGIISFGSKLIYPYEFVVLEVQFEV